MPLRQNFPPIDVPRMLLDALGSALRAALRRAPRCAADPGPILFNYEWVSAVRRAVRTMQSLSSGAHSRDPLASPSESGVASGSIAIIQSMREAINAAMRAFRL